LIRQTPGVGARTRRSRQLGITIGIVGVVLITLFSLAVDPPVSIPVLLMLIPVTACGLLSGWRWSVAVAVMAAASFAIFSLEPHGSPTVRVGADLLVLVTFLVVAVAVSYMSARRQRADQQLLDDRRLALLHGVSHDLRSPLTTIRAISSDLLVASDHYDDATRDQMLEQVVAESARLDRIVGNLLSAVRIQAGDLLPSTQPEPIGALIDFSIRRLSRGSGDLRVEVDVSHDLPDVAVDPVQIDQVISNLLENAQRHGASSQPVRIVGRWPSPTAGDEFVEISVADGGPGFAGSARGRIFEPFSSTGSGVGSAGLGLAVCKAIVEAHGGTIWLNEHGGPGAELRFTVPVASVGGDSGGRG